MPAYLAALALALCPVLVLTRLIVLRRSGTHAMHFGSMDNKDFLIPPFALVYFYVVFAGAFGWPLVGSEPFFTSAAIDWIGVAFCFAGLAMVMLSLVAFGTSFRVGIDTERPDKLVTSGVFAVSRNPIYVGFGLVLLGEFLVFPTWIPLIYLLAGVWLFNRQVLREEAFMREHYGREYAEYCGRVRRYL
ncbi:methyltransferase family protein [Mycolicibacter kumamotonensis]|uniref:Isoprenylcysteine carboxylmethyltransferase family protein n=1 Tax=Mycolicibacter kumamotonensis TaxID=354243 RepID=A0A7K3LB98_9MYCO|nr:isoprenylcysteine carboxylmethyltransferase family protein [Mycolicibacter kumamotonensis]NDJ89634.1 isoprenylcysteine carboxylmethyltransferase family protein [Mycolicibacter kumamotonensis]